MATTTTMMMTKVVMEVGVQARVVKNLKDGVICSRIRRVHGSVKCAWYGTTRHRRSALRARVRTPTLRQKPPVVRGLLWRHHHRASHHQALCLAAAVLAVVAVEVVGALYSALPRRHPRRRQRRRHRAVVLVLPLEHQQLKPQRQQVEGSTLVPQHQLRHQCQRQRPLQQHLPPL